MKKQFIKFSVMMLTAAVMTFSISCNGDDDPPTLSLDPSLTEIVFTADAMTATINGTQKPPTFTVVTNQKEWNAEKNQTWVSITDKTATGFKLSVLPNETIVEREDQITVSAGNATPVTFKVKQSADNHRLTVTPSDRTVVFAADGTTTTSGAAEFTVQTNVGAWEADPDADQTWLNVETLPNNKFKLVAAENTSLQAREAVKVTVTAGNAPSVIINVSQAAGEGFLRLSTASVVIDAAGAAATKDIETNYEDWEFETNQSWVKLSKTGNTLTVSAEPNIFNDPIAQARVTVKAVVASGEAPSVNFSVSQQANPDGYKVWQTPENSQNIKLKLSDYMEYDGLGKVAAGTIDNFNINYDPNTGGTYAGGPYTTTPDYRKHPSEKGYMYNWYYAKEKESELCPSPWRVPTLQDIKNFDKALGGTGELQSNVPAQSAKYTELGFIKSGRLTANHWMNDHRDDSGQFEYIGVYSYVQSKDERPVYNENMAPHLLINFQDNNVAPGNETSSSAYKRHGLPVRCIKDVE